MEARVPCSEGVASSGISNRSAGGTDGFYM